MAVADTRTAPERTVRLWRFDGKPVKFIRRQVTAKELVIGAKDNLIGVRADLIDIERTSAGRTHTK